MIWGYHFASLQELEFKCYTLNSTVLGAIASRARRSFWPPEKGEALKTNPTDLTPNQVAGHARYRAGLLYFSCVLQCCRPMRVTHTHTHTHTHAHTHTHTAHVSHGASLFDLAIGRDTWEELNTAANWPWHLTHFVPSWLCNARLQVSEQTSSTLLSSQLCARAIRAMVQTFSTLREGVMNNEWLTNVNISHNQ